MKGKTVAVFCCFAAVVWVHLDAGVTANQYKVFLTNHVFALTGVVSSKMTSTHLNRFMSKKRKNEHRSLRKNETTTQLDTCRIRDFGVTCYTANL